eukprot:364081-Chlamydomonas_euryale.AAC.4
MGRAVGSAVNVHVAHPPPPHPSPPPNPASPASPTSQMRPASPDSPASPATWPSSKVSPGSAFFLAHISPLKCMYTGPDQFTRLHTYNM